MGATSFCRTVFSGPLPWKGTVMRAEPKRETCMGPEPKPVKPALGAR
jgi:hypothetical protein